MFETFRRDHYGSSKECTKRPTKVIVDHIENVRNIEILRVIASNLELRIRSGVYSGRGGSSKSKAGKRLQIESSE